VLTSYRNRVWNVDIFGVLRHRYLTPAFAVKVGASAIRNCFRDQLAAIKKEGLDYMGTHPCVFTELGIPYDMEDGAAYKTGDFSSQALAMDANHFALEGNKSNFTLWNYTATNTHEYGDQWNGEDLSIYSVDDQVLPLSAASKNTSTASLSGVASESETSSIASLDAKSKVGLLNSASGNEAGHFRAAEAYIRPTPVYTHGDVVSFGFDLKTVEFKMSVSARSSATTESYTEIFLPTYHFEKGQFDVHIDDGRWDLDVDDCQGTITQRLRWWYPAGQHTISIKAAARRAGRISRESPMDQCMDKCSLM